MADNHYSHSVVLQHHNRMFREMLAALLSHEPDIVLAGSAASGPELVQLCDLRRPSVALFEADTPRWSNERLVSLLLPPGRTMRTIGLHKSLPTAHIIRAYEAGVSALVPYVKGLAPLLEAIRAPTLDVEAARAKQGNDALTQRELEVLYLVCAGYQPRQIGVELGISPHTVDRHKQGIYAKLAVHNEAQAAGKAVRLGLLASKAHPEQHSSPRPAIEPGVTLRPSDGPIAQRAREVLDAGQIAVLDGAAPVQVLIDPPVGGWHADNGEILVLTTTEPDQHHVTQALTEGVAILPVSRMDSLLVLAVRMAMHGYLAVSSAHLRGGNGQQWQPTLTPREHEILTAISRGNSTKQIARLLGISVRTVENLQSNLFRKLRVHRKAAALIVAQDLGLLQEE
jgi:DNA-binding NarL/FixJ family response regulator